MFPTDGPKNNQLKEIHCRIPNEQLILDFDYGGLRANIRKTLKRVIWYVNDFENVSLAAENH